MTRTLPTRRPATTAASLAAAVVLALGLTACGSDDEGDAGDTSSTSATPSAAESSASSDDATSATPTESGAADDSSSAAAAPDDAQTVSTLGVSFAVPDDYLVLDAAEVFASGNDDVVNDLADKLGVTPEQLRQQFQSVDLLAADRDTDAGEFTDNVNALDTGASALPTEDQAQSSFEQLGFTVSGSESVSTPVGDGLLVSYEGSASGLDFAGRGLFVDVDGTVVNITVSAGDADTADENADLITSTLAPAA